MKVCVVNRPFEIPLMLIMPSLSSKRSRRSFSTDDCSDPVPKTDSLLAAGAAESSSGSANTTGLLALPIEVYARIHNELLARSRIVTRKDVQRNVQYITGKTIRYRADVFRPLAQTCQALRRFYLPEMYAHVEACIFRDGSQQWAKQLGERLEKLCGCLKQHDDLRKFVQ